MARTIAEIHDALIAEKQLTPELATLTSNSRVAVWRLWLYVVAVAIHLHESMFDAHKAEVLDIISKMKPHTKKWYAQKAVAYQHGQDLVDDADYYDNSALTDEEVEESKVVAYAAVVEVENGLRIKAASLVGNDLAPLSAEQMDGFVEYMGRIKDAGVKLLITSGVADSLRLKLQVYYNPLVLNSNGERLDGGGSTPIQDAVKQYLKNLPFNGVFVLAYLVDQLQQLEGVVIPHVVLAQARYGALPYLPFAVQYQPDAGYLRFDADMDLEIEWIPQTPVQ